MNDDPVSQSAFDEFKAFLDERFKSLESRLTVRLVIAAVAGSALGKALSPTVAAGIAALGAAGWAAKVALASLLHR